MFYNKSILYEIVLIKNESQDLVLTGQFYSRIDFLNYPNEFPGHTIRIILPGDQFLKIILKIYFALRK